MTNRILFYVHFNHKNELADHVYYQLEKIRPIFDQIFFISNSVLSGEDLQRLQSAGLINEFLQRENAGYDFKAWSDGMNQVGFDELTKYDSVTLMNDTCFGPIFDFESTFNRMTSDDSFDFWGITNNRSQEVAPPWAPNTRVKMPDHIQSYFVSYKQKVVQSDSFRQFWADVEILDDVVRVIIRYETAMTQYFKDAGFRPEVLFDTRTEPWDGMLIHDFSVFALPELVKRRIPFLKIKAFSYGAESIYTPLVMETIRRESDYPTQFITDHMTFVDYPDREYMLTDKTFEVKELPVLAGKNQTSRVAIHLHVFYVDLLKEFIQNFDTYVVDYALFITTDTEEKKTEILSILTENGQVKPNLKEITVTGNLGRDVRPWQIIHEKLNDYDIVGHFHTKKSALNAWIVGESWREDIIDSLVRPAQNVFRIFEENPKIGLVIPDVPSFFNFHRGPNFFSENQLWPKMVELWEKIDFPEQKSLTQRMNYVMAFGTMLWYRPKALNEILNVDISKEIPEEPLPFDSVLHAFERLLVYVAWGSGFDYRILQINPPTGFTVNSSANRMTFEAKGDLNLLSTKEIIRLLLRKIKRKAKKILGMKISQ
ncbi:rhamnan synthesis F family protein [Lactovum odontotermitis]